MKLVRALTVVSLVALPFLAWNSPVFADENDIAARLSVSGEGVATAVPDMATITLGVRAQGETASDALDETSAVGADILAKLEEFDIEARDVQTSDLSLNPIYTRNNSGNEAPLIVGFEASNRVTVRVRDLDRLGAVLGAVTGEGANQMYGLNFGFEDTDTMMDEARRKAVADARAKAELYAEAAGVTLGRVISLSEQGGYRPVPMPVAEMRMAADSVPIAAGESALSASVSMVFEIVQ